MSVVFFNGPVQNGDFTFSTAPGKAVGIRITDALNQILGVPPVPHLWNTVRLTGDQRHCLHTTTAASSLSRPALEAQLIAAKYDTGWRPPAGVLTDADQMVAEMALTMIEQRLSAGVLAIRAQEVLLCTRCDHMTGTGGAACRSCGHTTTTPRTVRLLVADRDPALPALAAGRIHASSRRSPAHLRAVADNVPDRLILSRTRAYGIDLAPVGLPGLVLDPRAGLHVAVLAAARRHQARAAVMTTTAGAAANIAAYGQPFTEHDGLPVLYALHGHLPYGQQQLPATPDDGQALFETWFLPLLALKNKNGVPAGQLPALRTYFRRTLAARPPQDPDPALLHAVRLQIAAGDTGWIGDRNTLAAALSSTPARSSPHIP